MVCGCDGNVYENECAAWAAGTHLDGASYACPPPADSYPCGYTFCRVGEEFCVEQYEAAFTCAPLPDTCRGTNPDCACAVDDTTGAAGAAGAPDDVAVRAAWDALTEELCFGSLPPDCQDGGPSIEIDCSAH
jgi:hypothetical protein